MACRTFDLVRPSWNMSQWKSYARISIDQRQADVCPASRYPFSIRPTRQANFMDISESVSLESFLPRGSEEDDGSVISAAGNANSSFLLAILQKAQALSSSDRSFYVLDQVHDAVLDGHWDTPLLRAISQRRSGNVKLLLKYGANPNGIPMSCMTEHTRGYRLLAEHLRLEAQADDGWIALRCPLREEDVVSVASQVPPLSEDRASCATGISLFWDDLLTPLASMGEDPSQSLVMAARVGSLEILDTLLDADADSQFWKLCAREAMNLVTTVPENQLSPSALSTTTPIHAAIEAGNMEMLEGLLARGCNPNTRALIVGPKALTPMQFAIKNRNVEAYAVLSSHPRADVNLLTPMYGVHVLHFAAASLMPEQLHSIDIPVSDAPTTALKHTLLHVASLPINIASLPIDEVWSPILAPKVQQSLHFVRETFRAKAPLIHKDPEIQQIAMCQYLVSNLGAGEIGKVDVHGNTALHYLAGKRDPDFILVNWMRIQEGGEDIWTTSRTNWVWSPRALWNDARAVVDRNRRWGTRGLQGHWKKVRVRGSMV